MAATLGLAVVAASPAWATAPANDDFANAETHSASFTDSLDTDDATTEGGEPLDPSCKASGELDILGHTVWYGLTISSGTEVTISTAGSDFDTLVAVYTGASFGSPLSEVTCHDDVDYPSDSTSLAEFTASSTTTHWVQISGYDFGPGDGGGDLALDVTITPPGADVSVAVADSADPVSVGGSPYTYTVSVGNAGPSGASSVSASTTLSGAARAINSATPSQGSCSISAPTVSCSLGSIASSGSATVTISVTPSATGTLTATSTVSATESDPSSGNNTDAESTTINNGLGCTITGTSGNDTLNGTNGADVICGLGGNDTIDGDNGNDTIYAGDGDDSVGGGNGADTIYGQGGNDDNDGETLLGWLLHLFDNGNDVIDGGPGNDTLDGQNGNDTLVDHSGTDSLSGSSGTDSIDVQDGVGGDSADGGSGSDTCTVDGSDSTNSC
jgi:Ca2+-binding RTX toxin-like protein